MTRVTVSILIPAYNAEQYILESVGSALSQTWKNVEVIVVDDGSTDSTLSILNTIVDSRLIVMTQKNKGAAAARNTAFDASSGDYIQYLDADDILAKNKLEEQMNLADQFGKDYAYASSWGIFYHTINDAQFHSNLLWSDFDSVIDWLVVAWTKQLWMQPNTWLVHRHTIKAVGRWNEALSLHDDGEFFCRVLLNSRGVKFCSNAKSYYRKGISSSLSSTISQKAVKSHFEICKLYEQHLLTVEDSPRTRQACATNYMHFHFAHYPNHKYYRTEAIDAAKRLGETSSRPQGTELFHMLRKLVGWRWARRIENFYYGKGLNRAIWKKRLLNA